MCESICGRLWLWFKKNKVALLVNSSNYKMDGLVWNMWDKPTYFSLKPFTTNIKLKFVYTYQNFYTTQQILWISSCDIMFKGSFLSIELLCKPNSDFGDPGSQKNLKVGGRFE